jgi:tetrahydromethanopterin S-methyltransferase subunit F
MQGKTMADSTNDDKKQQSGVQVFVGILGFMIGFILLLVLIKYLFGL